ncbi:uncharacterized protein LOC111094954 isoform X5 [Canis lupus familiaris]|uniref:uncharacterized protein LOC111094954 isoform X5 n=1 Tax=Canis lupus familiaris TaxID=9615 RepID=UPI0018F29330|nr:uncharacterized protein LOC111094954 isoform X5 [Canis lupus familiaris]
MYQLNLWAVKLHAQVSKAGLKGFRISLPKEEEEARTGSTHRARRASPDRPRRPARSGGEGPGGGAARAPIWKCQLRFAAGPQPRRKRKSLRLPQAHPAARPSPGGAPSRGTREAIEAQRRKVPPWEREHERLLTLGNEQQEASWYVTGILKYHERPTQGKTEAAPSSQHQLVNHMSEPPWKRILQTHTSNDCNLLKPKARNTQPKHQLVNHMSEPPWKRILQTHTSNDCNLLKPKARNTQPKPS